MGGGGEIFNSLLIKANFLWLSLPRVIRLAALTAAAAAAAAAAVAAETAATFRVSLSHAVPPL